MARDRIEEIVSRRSRSSRFNPVSHWEIQELSSHWQEGTGSLLEADFILIRLVTMLEVFTRTWIAMLVDAGEPYVERAGDLVGGSLKFDFGVVRALAGKQVSVGELVGHSVSVNTFPDLYHIFSTLVGSKVFQAIEQLADRWESEVNGVSEPIIPDIADTRRKLSTLFTVRHIVVHEIPHVRPYEPGDVEGFVAATSQFVHAVDQCLDTMLNGDFPLQQQLMNADAWQRAEEKDAELKAWIESQEALKASPLFTQTQESWMNFREAQSAYVGGYDQEWPGTIAPLLKATEYQRMTVARLDEIQRFVAHDGWN